MSLDDLQLTSWLRKNLYGNYLVKEEREQDMEIAGKAPVRDSASTIDLLILVNEPQYEFANSEETQLLERLLKACNIQNDDTKQMNLATAVHGVEALIKLYKPKRVLIFGKDINLPLGMASEVPDRVYFDGAQILVAPTLAALRLQSQLRVPLWERLQQFFDLKEAEK